MRVRQFPRFVKDFVERHSVLRRPYSGGRTFHLCFFSCQSHFAYLYCSLHSLERELKDIPFKVWIFSDEQQPLSKAQIAAIDALIPGARVLPWPRSSGWGFGQIENIWRAYGLAAEGVDQNDILAKIDSDVFFFNDTVFRVAARSDADLIGDGHYVNFAYCQGGCYFLKVAAVRKINAKIASLGIEEMLKGIDVVVEDMATNHLAKRLNLNVWLTWYMMFPDELKNAGGLTRWYRWKFSCLHFVMKRKEAMLEAYEREVLRGQSPTRYREVLTTP